MAHGVGTVLDAAKRLKERAPSVHWVIAGDGAEREALEARAKAEGLSRVRFLGQVPRDDVPGLLAATDISLVLLRNAPLFRTVLPSKMFEAMAAARPILLGVDGEARRVLEESGGGRFVPPEDATALAHEVESLAGDPAARRRLGERGRRHVGEAFDRRRLALGLLQVLEAACVHDPAHPTVRAPVGLRRRVEHAAG
jgi:hypothetical protein